MTGVVREPLDAVIEAYANLVVRVGINVQLGQRVVIRGAVELERDEPDRIDDGTVLSS